MCTRDMQNIRSMLTQVAVLKFVKAHFDFVRSLERSRRQMDACHINRLSRSSTKVFTVTPQYSLTMCNCTLIPKQICSKAPAFKGDVSFRYDCRLTKQVALLHSMLAS